MRRLILITLCLLTAACVSTRARHGYVIERGEEALDAQVGIDTKESVLARFGEPSVRPAMSDDVWYYVSSSSNSRAFYQTQTTAREVVAFAFTEDDRVRDVVSYGLEDGRPVDIVSRVTPTRGKELSFLQQLIGGVGQLPGVGQDAARPGDPNGGGR